MDGAELINYLKIATNTENSDIPDSTYELALSESHTKIVEKIKAKVDSKLFYTEKTADLEIGKKEYNDLPITSASAVWIKYSEFEADWVTPGKYVKSRIKDITELDKSLADLEENQSQSRPIFMIADNSIFLYPVADEDVTDGIQVRGKVKVPRITATSPESEIFDWKLSEYQEVIVQWAKWFIYEVDTDKSSAREARAEYRTQLEVMITEISARYDQPIPYEEPNLNYLTVSSAWGSPFNWND